MNDLINEKDNLECKVPDVEARRKSRSKKILWCIVLTTVVIILAASAALFLLLKKGPFEKALDRWNNDIDMIAEELSLDFSGLLNPISEKISFSAENLGKDESGADIEYISFNDGIVYIRKSYYVNGEKQYINQTLVSSMKAAAVINSDTESGMTTVATTEIVGDTFSSYGSLIDISAFVMKMSDFEYDKDTEKYNMKESAIERFSFLFEKGEPAESVEFSVSAKCIESDKVIYYICYGEKTYEVEYSATKDGSCIKAEIEEFSINAKFSRSRRKNQSLDMSLKKNDRDIITLQVDTDNTSMKIIAEDESGGNVSVSAEIEKLSESLSSFSMNASNESGEEKGEINLEGTIETCEGDFVIDAKLNVNFQDTIVSASLKADTRNIKKTGETVCSLKISEDSLGENLELLLQTLSYSNDKSELKIVVKENGSETMSAVATCPSAVQPVISNREQKYIDRSKMFFENYDAIMSEVQNINDGVLRIATGGKYLNGAIKICDSNLDMEYISVINHNGKTVSVQTVAPIDYENYTYTLEEYVLDESNSYILHIRQSDYNNDVSSVKSAMVEYFNSLSIRGETGIESDIVPVYYYYSEKYDAYILCKNSDAYGWNNNNKWEIATKVPENSDKYFYHEVVIKNNKAECLHNFIPNQYVVGEFGDRDCYKVYECEDCKIMYRGEFPAHEMTDSIVIREKDDPLGPAVCHSCKHCDKMFIDMEVNGFNVRVHLVKGEYVTVLYGLKNAETEHGIKLPCADINTYDWENSMFVTAIENKKTDEASLQKVFAIPSITDATGKTIAGIYNHESILFDMEKLIIPEGVRFIFAGAFRNIEVGEIILPESMEYVDDNVFSYANVGTETIVLPEGIIYYGTQKFIKFSVDLNA